MCRSIRILHHFEPPTTPDEIRAAALQYVRKVSGSVKPSKANAAAFQRAVEAIDAVTSELLGSLEARGEPRTRAAEIAKARARFAARSGKLD